MAALEWDPSAIRSHLRLTRQRLGQLQVKLDSEGNTTRKDIATLLQQGNVCLARAKAYKLVREDTYGDLLDLLENEIGTLLEHSGELDTSPIPTPTLAQPLSSIIFTAPYIPCKELAILRTTIIQRFGPEFATSAARNKDNCIHPRIAKLSSRPMPSASMSNAYLSNVARSYGVNWTPDPQRNDILPVLSEILNPPPSESIDLTALRRFCSYGIPDEPAWLRPRIWKLFFGVLPKKRDSWRQEMSKQRDCYYDLVRRLLEPYTSLPPPSQPPHPSDEALLNIVHHLTRIPRQMFSHLAQSPEELPSCPLSTKSSDEIKVPNAFALDDRMKALREKDGQANGNANGNDGTTPEISLSNYDTSAASQDGSTETLVAPRAYSFGDGHPLHCSAFLRLLFIHAAINPGRFSPHIPALLVPLYTALHSEVEIEDLSHVEADTFWLFEAIVAEFSELDEGEGTQKWMSKFDQTLSWADPELHESLTSTGLQPSLPHYSYRWLAPVLTYTIPIPPIFLIWDALFARLPRERDFNPKLDFMVYITSSMLTAVKKELLRLGQSPTPNVPWWADGESALEGRPNADGDPFLEGLSLLQAYPCTSVADAERIIQCANDLLKRRQYEQHKPLPNPSENQGFGARLRQTMWKGFTNQLDSPNESPDEEPETPVDDGNETERPSQETTASSSWWSNLAVSRASQVANEEQSHPEEDESGYSSSSTKTASLWEYAEKLKDSDTAATLAKVGTNWRAKAMSVGSWGHSKAKMSQTPPVSNSGILEHDTRLGEGHRRESSLRTEIFVAPPFPSPPNSQRSDTDSSSSSSMSPIYPEHPQQESLVDKTKTFLSIIKSPPATSVPKALPRPLLLNSVAPITASPVLRATTPDSDWAEVMKAKKRYLSNRDSRSSISSLSPSEAMKSSRSDWDSDSGSRVVPLNRRSISPMAPGYRMKKVLGSPTLSTTSPVSASSTFSAISPSPIESRVRSAPAMTGTMAKPTHKLVSGQDDSIKDTEEPFADFPTKSDVIPEPKPLTKLRLDTKVSVPSGGLPTDDADAPSSAILSRHSRVRSRRQIKPPNLQLKAAAAKAQSPLDKTPHASTNTSLTVDWPVGEIEVASTPKASSFDASDTDTGDAGPPVSPRARRRKVSTSENRDRSTARRPSHDEQEPRVRKISNARTRKTSNENREVKRSYRRESEAEEGDDEGYDELLSAYESEDNVIISKRVSTH
ncbi:hypothetical protein FA15DRAFT_751981 [Coprinopsis marcescibilis]|uniref:Rab-GAP TBC domain-containing protein n=1 Tax=Coprinopsis marcescibilis TaxID=230819 RepID=A0A5C3LAK2_COPMA|nr:hypothetical protein FA15DRAFT_751981 [Coprinopsis marcescibilis]